MERLLAFACGFAIGGALTFHIRALVGGARSFVLVLGSSVYGVDHMVSFITVLYRYCHTFLLFSFAQAVHDFEMIP